MYRNKYLKVLTFLTRYSRDPFSQDKVTNLKRIVDRVGRQLNIVDGFANQEFAVSSKGWILSDIALLQRASSQKELDFALSRLREVGVINQTNEGKSVNEILSDVLPRYVQTPAELQRYVSFYSSTSFNDDVEVIQKVSKLNDNDVVTDNSIT